MRVREANQVLGQISTPDEGYRALAAAVIAQACDDYARAVKYCDAMRIQTIERWLMSDSFTILSQNMEGAYILQKLRECDVKYEEAKEAKRVRRFDEYGNLIGEYASLREAEQISGTNRKTIRRCIDQGRPYNGNWWEFA